MNPWRLGSIGLTLFLAASACSRFSTTQGCTKDGDCKGDRVCVDGKCVAPTNTTPPAPTQAQATAAPVTTSTAALGKTGPSSAPTSGDFGPKVGTYTNGPEGTPHYILTVSAPAPGRVAGNVTMLYQNGRMELAFTFTGVTKPTTMIATLTTSTGRTVSAPYLPRAHARSSMTLNDCTTYLKWATSASACEFETHDF